MPTATDAYTSGLREARRPGGGISWKTVSDPEADRMVVDMAEAIIAEGGLPTTKRIIESLPISPYAAYFIMVPEYSFHGLPLSL